MPKNAESGRFVISLDTELSWGSFDTVGIAVHEPAYRNTRSVIDGLCSLFDSYETPVTWALVMHLLDDCSGHNEPLAPNNAETNWFDSLPCSTNADRDLWYAPDILERIGATNINHEIGLHGYAHKVLSPKCPRDAARSEVLKAIAVANRVGLDPDTYVFPRNKIGHLDVLADADIQYYRGVDERWYERQVPETLRKPFRYSDEVLRRTPPVVSPRRKGDLIELPGSQILRPFQGPWQYTPRDSQLVRAKKGLNMAARTGEIFHLWFHPFNIALNQDRHLTLVEDILSHAARLRENGHIQINTIAQAIEGK